MKYRVEKLSARDEWKIIPFAGGSRDWCDGYTWAFADLYPSPRVRVVRLKDMKVIAERGGNSKPRGMHTN